LMSGLLADQEVGAIKSGVSRVNSCTFFTRSISSSVVLSAKIISGPITALINATVTDIFCR